jgi:trehalose/maltose hydrolase-like predicted phosphorylase
MMLFYLFSAEELGELFERLGYPFEYETIPCNIAYYAGRSSHGSTLRRVVHAWVLARSDRPRSMQFFAQALQSDVSDIQQGTTAEGVHLGAMAGTVDLVQRVWTGIEVKGDVLRLHPELPQDIGRLDMRIRYRGHSLDLRLTRHSLTVRGHDAAAPPIALCVDGKVCEFVGGTTRVFRMNDEATLETAGDSLRTNANTQPTTIRQQSRPSANAGICAGLRFNARSRRAESSAGRAAYSPSTRNGEGRQTRRSFRQEC